MSKNFLSPLQWAIDRDREYRESQRARVRDDAERRASARARALQIAGGRTCEETTGTIGDTYLRCGAPAVVLLRYRGRDEGPYAMCYACADHNLRNRNAGVVEWFDKELEQQTEGRYRPL